MANEQYITIRGRLTADPELRFTPKGDAVANFTIAANARKFDKQANDWKDADAIFWRCQAWRELGENVAESLTKGMAVVALAELESRSFETREGEKRTVTEAKVEAIGPDLRWSTAKVTKANRNNNTGGGGYSAPQGQGAPAGAPAGGTQGGWGGAPQADPWGGSQSGFGGSGDWAAPAGQEPPF